MGRASLHTAAKSGSCSGTQRPEVRCIDTRISPVRTTTSGASVESANEIVTVRPITQHEFDEFAEVIPSFQTIVPISCAFSAGVGMTAGLLLHPVLKLIAGRVQLVPPPLWLLDALSLIFYLVYRYR